MQLSVIFSQPTKINEKADEPLEKPNPLAALFPPGLQQMQQLLQSQLVSGNFNPTQLQHIMQQHSLLSHHQVCGFCFLANFFQNFLFVLDLKQQLADAGRKQLEQLLHQLQEQLQINLLQQSHMMQTKDELKKGRGLATNAAALQQLQLQQQQIISQLQLVQQRLLMVRKIWNVFNPANKTFKTYLFCAQQRCQISIARKK